MVFCANQGNKALMVYFKTKACCCRVTTPLWPSLRRRGARAATASPGWRGRAALRAVLTPGPVGAASRPRSLLALRVAARPGCCGASRLSPPGPPGPRALREGTVTPLSRGPAGRPPAEGRGTAEFARHPSPVVQTAARPACGRGTPVVCCTARSNSSGTPGDP